MSKLPDFIRFNRPDERVPRFTRNLGDKVHAVAHPVAKVIDRVAGTRLSTCGGCAERRRKLNELADGKRDGMA